MIREDLHPFAYLADVRGRAPRAFAQGAWIVFLDTEQQVPGAIQYVGDNPMRKGMPPQKWSFVTPFDQRAPLRVAAKIEEK